MFIIIKTFYYNKETKKRKKQKKTQKKNKCRENVNLLACLILIKSVNYYIVVR